MLAKGQKRKWGQKMNFGSSMISIQVSTMTSLLLGYGLVGEGELNDN
jgi:hypothetical protein